ncbi:hypothetical protein L6164_018874 [Bauhinia variegata]|uniref:Uncharacterized protein n=1 Tax=Bauhinia variegata TaxID=167791 RepID=A0ACB9NEA5_BAUVA|nr:hypothetical protein L6164_018874 [Bauhinia variegata]
MTRQALLRSPAAINRRSEPRQRRGVGEMAGNAAAECTAVCCCCPCAVMDLVVLAIYKVPAGLCKKAIHKNKRHHTLKNENHSHVVLIQRPCSNCSAGSHGNMKTTLEEHLRKEANVAGNGIEVAEYGDWEKEMWARFNGTGFWRSPSQRQT